MILRYARWLANVAFVAVGIWLAFWHHHDAPGWGLLLVFALAVIAAGLKAIARDR